MNIWNRRGEPGLGYKMGVWKSLVPLTWQETESRWRRNPGGAIADVARFARERLGFQPDEKQEALLRCDAKQGILNCSRQWGKSTVAAIKAVHRAHTVAKSMVVVASPTERQSAEFVLKARGFVTKLGLRARGDGHNRDAACGCRMGRALWGCRGKRPTFEDFPRIFSSLMKRPGCPMNCIRRCGRC